MTPMSNQPSLRLAELMASLSLAMDLGTGQPLEWVMKCCLLGVRLAELLGLGESDRRQVYYLSLLRHIGCTAIATKSAELLGDDIFAGGIPLVDSLNPPEMMGFLLSIAGKGQPPVQRVRTLANVLISGAHETNAMRDVQCEIAGQMAGTFKLDLRIQDDLRQLFERWDGNGFPKRLKGESLSLPVRVVHLAQDAVSYHMARGLEAATAVARQRSGGLYDPALVDVFCRAAPDLLIPLDAASLWDTLLAAEPGEQLILCDGALNDALQAVADFADMKSPYILKHSRNVAELAEGTAKVFGLPEIDRVAVRRAGWLHNLGQVAVSSLILNKPGPLSESEWERVRLHPYYTERILARSSVLQPLGTMASMHHERLDGSGYHRHLTSAALSPVARILAVADAYCAMTANRPHRPALTADLAAAELTRESKAGRFDPEVVEAVLGAAGHPVRPRRKKSTLDLSQREVEVLRLLARGLSNRQIAGELFISVKTVGHHVQHIYTKCGVSTRAGATLFALQNNLLA